MFGSRESKARKPLFGKKGSIKYYKVSDETLSMHVSDILPKWENTNPLAHQTINRSMETAKKGVDMLGTRPKKENKMMAYMVMGIMVIMVVALIYYAQSTEAQKDAAKNAATQTITLKNGTKVVIPAPAQSNKPHSIIPIPLPGLG